jgi:hypothetical protein
VVEEEEEEEYNTCSKGVATSMEVLGGNSNNKRQ